MVPPPAAEQQVTFPNDYSLGNSTLRTPRLAVFATGNQVFVADTLANRVVRYTAPAQFVRSDSTPSPKIEGVIGQPDLVSGKANHGLIEPDASSLSSPLGGAFDSAGNLWVVDTNNNRVLSYPASGTFSYISANIVVGQTDFPFNAPNLIEGREVWFFNNGCARRRHCGGQGSNPPHLYIADTFNNRILGFRDARAVGADARSLLTQKPDLVIGQPAGDFFRSIVNYPNGDPGICLRPRPDSCGRSAWRSMTAAICGWPIPVMGGCCVSPRRSAWRREPSRPPILVLGQNSFTNKDQSASAQTMNTPYGLALFPGGHLAVSDPALNRVLVFKKSSRHRRIRIHGGWAAELFIGRGFQYVGRPEQPPACCHGFVGPPLCCRFRK